MTAHALTRIHIHTHSQTHHRTHIPFLPSRALLRLSASHRFHASSLPATQRQPRAWKYTSSAWRRDSTSWGFRTLRYPQEERRRQTHDGDKKEKAAKRTSQPPQAAAAAKNESQSQIAQRHPQSTHSAPKHKTPLSFPKDCTPSRLSTTYEQVHAPRNTLAHTNAISRLSSASVPANQPNNATHRQQPFDGNGGRWFAPPPPTRLPSESVSRLWKA
jgi:hypothetical protein